MRFVIAASILTATTIAGAALADEKPSLNVYTYDSFIPEWGPGPQIEAGFEAICDCDLVFTAAGDGAALLTRLRLEGERSPADIVLGLDTNLIASAKESGLIAQHGLELEYALPIEWEDTHFVPFDWGYFAFVHNRGIDAPQSFEELAASDLKIVIQDPRSSTPGLGLLMWIEAAYEERAGEIWGELADNIVTVTPGWSEAYGLFIDGDADMVLSYTTSPAYHLIAEEDDSKTAALFEEGHYMQVEVAAKLTTAQQPQLADLFLSYLLGQDAQSVLPTTNWMYPAALLAEGLPDGFETLIEPQKALLFSPEDASARREAAIETWRNALAR